MDDVDDDDKWHSGDYVKRKAICSTSKKRRNEKKIYMVY